MNKFRPYEFYIIEDIATILLHTNSVISNSSQFANNPSMLLAQEVYISNLQIHHQEINPETVVVELFTAYIQQKFARQITCEEYFNRELTDLKLLAITKERELYSVHYIDRDKTSLQNISQYILDVMQIYTLNIFIFSKMFRFSTNNDSVLDLSVLENAITATQQDILDAKEKFSKIKISENKYIRIAPANTYYINMLNNGLSNILDYCNQLRILSIDTRTLTDDMNFEDHALHIYGMIHKSIQYHSSAKEPMNLPSLAIANKIIELANFYFSPNPSTAKIFFSAIQTSQYRWRLQSFVNNIEELEVKLAAITFFMQFVTGAALDYAIRLQQATFTKYFSKLSERDLCNYFINFEKLRYKEDINTTEEFCLHKEAHSRFGTYWYEHCMTFKRKIITTFTEDVRPAI